LKRTLLALAGLVAFAATACGYSDPYAGTPPIANESPGPSAAPSVSPGADDFNTCRQASGVTYPDGLKVADLKVGTGATVAATDTVTVNYIGVSCSTGKIFDSSYMRGQPASLPLNGVIQGWQVGMQGMKVGGQRLLGIPRETVAVVPHGIDAVFTAESWGELKKVEWPRQPQVIQGTAVVLIACLIVGVYLYANDLVWKRVVQNVFLGQ